MPEPITPGTPAESIDSADLVGGFMPRPGRTDSDMNFVIGNTDVAPETVRQMMAAAVATIPIVLWVELTGSELAVTSPCFIPGSSKNRQMHREQLTKTVKGLTLKLINNEQQLVDDPRANAKVLNGMNRLEEQAARYLRKGKLIKVPADPQHDLGMFFVTKRNHPALRAHYRTLLDQNSQS